MFIPPGLLSVAIVGRQARVEVLNRWKEITSVHCSSLPDQVDHKGGIVPVEVSVFCGPWLHSAGNRRSMPVPVLREHSSTDSHLPGRATLWMHLDANRSCFSDKNAPTYTTLGPSRRVEESSKEAGEEHRPVVVCTTATKVGPWQERVSSKQETGTEGEVVRSGTHGRAATRRRGRARDPDTPLR